MNQKRKQYKAESEQRRRKRIKDEQYQQQELIKQQQDQIQQLQSQTKKQQDQIQQLQSQIKQQQDELQQFQSQQQSNQQSTRGDQFMMNVLSSGKTCESVIGMSANEFDALFQRALPQFESTTARGSPAKRVNSPTPSVSHRLQLFICLLWLRQYPLLSFLSVIFDLHCMTITRILKRALIVLETSLDEEIKWPCDKEMVKYQRQFKHMQPRGFRAVTSAVDGSEFEVERPVDNKTQYELYSAKKKQHSLNVLFVCLLNGLIIYVSKSQKVSNDQSHWNASNLRKRFEGKKFGLVGDGGFYFNRKVDKKKIHGFTPYKKPTNTQLTQEQKDYNKKLSKIRVVIENVIAQIKNWRIFKTVFRHYDSTESKKNQIPFDRVVRVVCCLTNMKIKQTPLRSKDWKPEL